MQRAFCDLTRLAQSDGADAPRPLARNASIGASSRSALSRLLSELGAARGQTRGMSDNTYASADIFKPWLNKIGNTILLDVSYLPSTLIGCSALRHSAEHDGKAIGRGEEETVEVTEFNQLAKELKQTLNLRTFPIAVKFCESIDEVPEEAIFPKRDLGKACAFCQAEGMARFNGRTVAMGKFDHWCWNPLLSFGLVDADPGSPAFEIITSVGGSEAKEANEKFWTEFPRFPRDKYPYVVVAPAERCTYLPDVVIIYADTHQTLAMIGGVRFKTGDYIKSQFDAIDACTHSIVGPMLAGNTDYKITFPDPGERARAHSREDGVIFTVPISKWDEFCDGVDKNRFLYTNLMLETDYVLENPVPPFYHDLFKVWGIEE